MGVQLKTILGLSVLFMLLKLVTIETESICLSCLPKDILKLSATEMPFWGSLLCSCSS